MVGNQEDGLLQQNPKKRKCKLEKRLSDKKSEQAKDKAGQRTGFRTNH